MTIIRKLSVFFACLLLISSAFAKEVKTTTFKVSGNCGMCKKHIENALQKQPGITKAIWNKETKLIKVVYDPAATNIDEMQKKIAAAGYDTPKFRGDDKAYKELDECCQYDRN